MRIEPNLYLVGSGHLGFDLSDPYDCNVPQTNASIQRLAGYDFEALLPGHLNFSMKNGKRHIETACALIETLFCPPSFI